MKYFLVVLLIIPFSVSTFASKAPKVELPSLKVSSSDMDEMEEASEKNKSSKMLSAIYNILGKDPKNLKALNRLGVHYFQDKKVGLARTVFERAQRSHPKEPAVINNLGVIALSEGDQRKAVLLFKRALALKSSYDFAATNLSSIYLEYKDYKLALGPLEDAYGDSSRDLGRGEKNAVELANNYALALIGAGSPKKAKTVYKKILDSGARNVDVMLNYAILLVKVLKDRKEGIREISRVKFLTEDKKVLRKIKELEEEVDQL